MAHMHERAAVFQERWSAARRRTHALIGSIGGVDLLFRPTPEYRTLHEQIAHIVAAEKSIVRSFTTSEFRWKENDEATGAMSIDQLQSLASTLDAELALLLSSTDDAWLRRESGYGMTREQWLWALLEHEIHHIGQISLTVRLGGGTPAKIFE